MALEGVIIGSGADPAAPGVSTALRGVSIGQQTTPAHLTAPTSTNVSGLKGIVPPTPAPIANAKRADTSSLFSRFLNFASGAVDKGLTKINDVITPPDLKKNATPSALQYLPSELARQIPGVAAIQDETSHIDGVGDVPTFGEYLNMNFDANDKNSDLVNALHIENAPASIAKGLASAPIIAGLDAYDAALLMYAPPGGQVFKLKHAELHVPGLTDAQHPLTSNEWNVVQRVREGESPMVAVLSEGSAAIFNALFLTDIVMRVASPRSVKVYEKTGDVSELPGGQNINSQPKTGRLYEKPSAENSGGAQIATPEIAAKMKAQIGANFDPKLPTFFRTTLKGTKYTGEIFQVRPSYLKMATDKIFGRSDGAPASVPRLLGEKPIVPSNTDLQKIADEAPAKEVQIFHSKMVTEANLETSIRGAVASEIGTPTQKSAPQQPPTPPTVAHTVIHNIIRLGDGDVSKAKDGETHLIDDIKESLAEHGPDVTSIQLQEKVGVDAQTAQRLIAEAKAHKTAAEEAALHKSITADILANRDDASIKADAIKHVADNQSALIDQYIKAHGNVVGADEAKEFLPGYSADRSISDLVAKGAAQMTDALYNHLIEKSDGKPVLMTGGGTGVGKSTATSGLNPKDFTVVFDSNSSNLPSAIARIDKALEKGLTVDFRFVYAPVDRAYDRVLDRAHLMAEEKGSGRPVSAQGHIDMHHGSQDMLPGLIEHYKDNPNVHIHIIDNSGTEAKAVSKPLDFIRKIADNRKDANELHQDLIKQRQAAVHEGRLSEKANTAFDRAELLRPKKDNGSNVEGNKEPQKHEDALAEKLVTSGPEFDLLSDSEKIAVERAKKHGGLFIDQGERGFVAPQKIAEDVAAKTAQMKDFIDETSEKIEVTAHTSDDLYKLENNAKRDLEIAIRLIRELKPDPRDMEAIYHYEEDKGVELTEKQQQIYDAVIKPLADTSAEIFSRLKNAGLPMTNEDYTPRFVKGKGNVLDRLMDAYEKGKSAVSTNQGGALSKTTGSMKHRTMKSIVDENGNRTVVSIKNQQFTTETGKKVMSKRVTAFRGNKPEDMGRFSTKTKEEVMNTEVEPVQREIKKIQKEIDRLVAQNESRQPVTASMLKTLSDKIDTMIQYVDSNVGAFTRKELAPDIRKIQDKSVEYNALAKVKQSIDQMKQIRNDRLVTLQGQMVSLVNKVGEIEGSYNPHELNDQVFTDKNGKSYTIAEATTKEIELHTKLEYHKNVIANRILQYLKLRQIERANQFIEDFKSHPDFSDIAVKVGEEAPSNYKITSLPQFRGYVMEPRIAETFDRFNEKMQTPNGLLATLAPINRFLRNAIFFNPLIHVPNITVHWLTNRGALRLANPAAYIRGAQSFARAWNAVVKRNEDYITALEQGAPLLASEASSRELGKVLLETMTKELEGNPDTASKVAAALGYANPANLIRAVYKFSGKFTWTVNDLLTMQAVYEDMAEKGVSLSHAITETGKHIPNYRIPERIFDKALTVTTGEEVGGNISHGLASMMQNPNLSMFGAYHYGALRSYGEMFSDFVKKGNTVKERAEALDKIAMLALIGLVLYPFVLDRIARAITGNPNAKMRRAGGTTLPDNVHEFLLGTKDAGQVFQSVVTPSPIAKMIPELVWNKDFWNDSQVYGAGGEGFLNFVADQISPIQQARNLSTGRMTPVNFFASLGGISSPKSTDSEKEVTSMIYQEKPALLKQMKALVAGGDEAGARDIAHEFNTRLQSSIKQSLIDNGKSGSDAQVQYIFKSNAVRMPSQKVMDNYNATQGLSWVDKVFAKGTKPVLPNDKPMENDSFIHGILVYANAIATDPQTAMTNILHGQVIRKVDNGTVIVRRMSLSDSQAIKTAEGGNNPTMKLDHTIPLQLGGTNEESNLSLVPTEQWASYTPVENYLGKALRAGTIDKGTAQKYMTDFKSGILTFDDIKSSI